MVTQCTWLQLVSKAYDADLSVELSFRPLSLLASCGLCTRHFLVLGRS